jgi:hypothetical protein
MGFVLPLDVWLRGSMARWAEDHINSSGTEGEVLERKTIQRRWKAFVSGDSLSTASRVWCLVALNAWIDEWGIGAVER